MEQLNHEPIGRRLAILRRLRIVMAISGLIPDVNSTEAAWMVGYLRRKPDHSRLVPPRHTGSSSLSGDCSPTMLTSTINFIAASNAQSLMQYPFF